MAAKVYNFIKQVHTVLLLAGMLVSVIWFQAKLSTIVEANEARDLKDHACFYASIKDLATQLDREQIYLNFISNKLETLDIKISKVK